MRVLVDTCVIIDALQSRVPYAEAAQKLFTLFHLLDTASLDCQKAISSEIGDYEDAIMAETAIRTEMDCIVTRNVKDYRRVAEEGTPAELMNKNGLYHRMVELQRQSAGWRLN